MASIILDKNKFVLEAAVQIMPALVTRVSLRDPNEVAKRTRELAIALWREMRHPIE